MRMSLDLYPACSRSATVSGGELGRTVQARNWGAQYRRGAGEDSTGEELESGAILCRNILFPVL